MNGTYILELAVPDGMSLLTGSPSVGISPEAAQSFYKNHVFEWNEPVVANGESKYRMKIQEQTYSSSENVTYTITYNVRINETAVAGIPQIMKAKVIYGDREQYASTEIQYNFYTFGFDLKTQSGAGNVLSETSFTLQDTSNNKYYTLPSDPENAYEERFKPAQNPPEIATDGTGKISFTGMAPGDYILTQIATNEGYEKMENSISIKIGADGALSLAESTLAGASVSNTSKSTSGSSESGAIATQYGTLVIINNAEILSTIPATGGIGTRYFYISGALIMLGAGMLLILKGRKVL